MFSAYQEPSHSSERISFSMNSETERFDRSFFQPSLTANQLSTEEINETLGQIDEIYRDKEVYVVRTVFYGIVGCLAFQRCAYRWHPYAYQARKRFYLGANALIFATTGLYIWEYNREAKEKAGKLLEEANKRIFPKGFRWYFPQNFSKIELYPDDTYDPKDDPNKLSLNQLSEIENWKKGYPDSSEACLDELAKEEDDD